MADLYHRFTGYDQIQFFLQKSDEDALVALGGRPALIRLPGTGRVKPRFVSCLLHGNEDSGYHAVLDLLRQGASWPFDLWVFIGNVRAACQEGWFAHRYLDDQEDFNRVWGLEPLTTRMRRCAQAVLTEVRADGLEGAIDLHNNTGDNPPYAVVPVRTPESLHLASLCGDTVLLWYLRVNALMEELSETCPTAAVECGMAGVPAGVEYAATVLERFLAADFSDDRALASPEHVFEMRHRVTVRPEVPFAFGGTLSDELDLVLTPGLDSTNFGMLLAGTEIGRVHPGAALPLMAESMLGEDESDRFFAVRHGGSLIVSEDVTPAMMTTTVVQTRRDCWMYLTRRRS
jgi:hypothetical protein